MGYSCLVAYAGMNVAEQGLTLLSRWEVLLSSWYDGSALVKFFSQKVTELKKVIDIACENEERNKGMKIRIQLYLLCWLDKKLFFLYNWLCILLPLHFARGL